MQIFGGWEKSNAMSREIWSVRTISAKDCSIVSIPLGPACFDVCTELMVISAANQIPYQALGEHDLNGGITPGPGCRGNKSR